MPAILPDPPAVEAAIIEMTNGFRAKQKLAPVSANAKLTAVARAYATFLANQGAFSHTADGRQAGERVTAQGYAWCQVSENLALHSDSRGFEARTLAEKAVTGWINSPGHRANLEAPFVTEIGVGVAKAPGPQPKYISVEVFARPEALSYEFQISNATGMSVAYMFNGERYTIETSSAQTHSSCLPGAIDFASVGGKAVSMRYQAMNGLVYQLKPNGAGGMAIEVKPREKAVSR